MWESISGYGNHPIDMCAYFEQIKKKETEEQTRIYNRLCKFFNVSEEYTDEELAKSYRRFLVKYHPDNPNGSLNKFDRVKEFYKKLKHARKYITDR